ncbi:MAG TPA: hypothetical protein VJV79_36240, partial [Polyangiaceae bacterium]|nr:hypothetical protein [Polyangiaceae bacterium]
GIACLASSRSMSDLRDLLERIVPALQQAGIPFMVAGSFASTAHGLPRATQDLDIVIAPTGKSLAALLALLAPEIYYVDADVARDAFRTHGMFNVIGAGSHGSDSSTCPTALPDGRPRRSGHAGAACPTNAIVIRETHQAGAAARLSRAATSKSIRTRCGFRPT